MKTEYKDPETTRTDDLNNIGTDNDKGVVPILPIRSMVAFPQMSVPFMISFQSAALIEDAMKSDQMVGLLTIKDAEIEDPVPGQLYEVGTIAKILHAKKNEEGVMVALLNGINRFKVATWHTDGPYLRANVVHAPEIVESGIELEALQRQLRDTVADVLGMMPDVAKEAADAITRIKDPLQLAYVTAFNLNLSTETRQSLLEIDSVSQKIRELLSHLTHEKEMLSIGKKIQSEVREKMNKS